MFLGGESGRPTGQIFVNIVLTTKNINKRKGNKFHLNVTLQGDRQTIIHPHTFSLSLNTLVHIIFIIITLLLRIILITLSCFVIKCL